MAPELLISRAMDLRPIPAALTISVLVMLGTVGSVRANLFTNGDFENTPLPSGTPYGGSGTATATTTSAVDVGAGTNIAGWTTTLGNGDAGAGNYFAGRSQTAAEWIPSAQSGNYSVQLDSRPGSGTFTIGNSIYQSLNLAAGSYQLTFYYRSELTNTTGVPATVGAFIGLNSGGSVGVNATGYQGIGQTFTARSDQAAGTAGNNIDPAWNKGTLNFSLSAAGIYRFTFLDGVTGALNSGNGTNTISTSSERGGFSDDSNISLDNFDLEIVPEFAHWAVFAVFGLLVAGSRRLRHLAPPAGGTTRVAGTV